MQSQDYIVDNDGHFRFTKVGLDNQSSLLAKAGIDASSIRTYEEYLQAREAASPFFVAYLQEETEKLLKGKPDSVEWQAIRSIAFGSADEQDRLLEKLKRKKLFKII